MCSFFDRELNNKLMTKTVRGIGPNRKRLQRTWPPTTHNFELSGFVFQPSRLALVSLLLIIFIASI